MTDKIESIKPIETGESKVMNHLATATSNPESNQMIKTMSPASSPDSSLPGLEIVGAKYTVAEASTQACAQGAAEAFSFAHSPLDPKDLETALTRLTRENMTTDVVKCFNEDMKDTENRGVRALIEPGPKGLSDSKVKVYPHGL